MDTNLLVIGLVWYVVFLLSTTCHEAAHALAAKLRRQASPQQKQTRRPKERNLGAPEPQTIFLHADPPASWLRDNTASSKLFQSGAPTHIHASRSLAPSARLIA